MYTRLGSGVVGELKRYLLMNLSSEKKNKETTKILLKSSLWLAQRIPWKKLRSLKNWPSLQASSTRNHVHVFMGCEKSLKNKTSKKNKSKHFIARSFRIEQINIFSVSLKSYQRTINNFSVRMTLRTAHQRFLINLSFLEIFLLS